MLTLKASFSHRYQTTGRGAKGSSFCDVLLEALEIFLCSEFLAFRVNLKRNLDILLKSEVLCSGGFREFSKKAQLMLCHLTLKW